jgi:hypothetical protein
MQPVEFQPPANIRVAIERFIATCRADSRVIAAFLGGSFARGAADAYSDLDLGLISTDSAFEELCAGRETLIRLLGNPLFLEDFDHLNNVHFILDDGTEGELVIGSESHFQHIHSGPYRVLVDKKEILARATFPSHAVPDREQEEALRRLVAWFWHDVSHFVSAMGRGQLWWAYGQLDILRRSCVNLIRLRYDFKREAELFDKVDQVLPAEALSPLRDTLCPLEKDAMLRAAHVIVKLYRDTVTILAIEHSFAYPERLDQLMCKRLDLLSIGNDRPA